MEKNTVWAIGLSTVVLVGFFAAQTFLFPPKPNQSAENQNEQASNVQEKQSENSEPSNLSNDSQISENQKILPSSEFSSEIENINLTEEKFTITTNNVAVTFTNRGGDIISYELIEKDERGNLKNRDADTNRGVELIENVTAKNRAFSLSLGGAQREIINDLFNSKQWKESNGDEKIGFFKKYSYKNADGTDSEFTLVKTYTFKPNDYTFKLDITIDGGENFKGLDLSGAAYTLRTAPQIGPKYNPKTDRYEYRQIVSFNGEKVKKTNIGQKQTKNYERDWMWSALAGKYFEFIVYPENKTSMSSTVVYTSEVESGEGTNAQIKVTRKSIDKNQTNDSYYIYAGPRNESELKKYVAEDKNEWKLSGVHFNESLQTSGFLYWLEVVLKFLLETVNKVVHNWGVSIIIVTIILKMALFPITKKSLEGTQKMQKFQPKMQELQAKYKGDPQKLQVETAKMYKEIGYNPMSGCLPMIFQFVILFAMYNLFNNYFEFRGASFIKGWIDDLSVGDHIGKTFETGLPFLGWNQIRILPVIYVISQLLFGKITGNGGTTSASQNAGQMKMLMYGMPIMFFFMFYNAPAGLLLYWTVSNIFQLGQQIVINKMMKGKELTIVSKNTKRR
ncbi:membrane protein insertase YidC [uncultured Treponema sp.]|uniref:membrane protein insertase YidC n=1 Tax=uncultured Treponema sp. TaxID=162155 RepID=UPI0025ECECF1|nr:membrane protein insertase YidC [uncultured Treponema sp.]